MSQQTDKSVGDPLGADCDYCSSPVPLRFIEEFLPLGEFCSKDCAKRSGWKKIKTHSKVTELQQAYAMRCDMLAEKTQEIKQLKKTLKSKDRLIAKMSSDLIGIGLAMSQLEDRLVDENTSLKTQLMEGNTKLQTQMSLLLLKLEKSHPKDPTQWPSYDAESALSVQGPKASQKPLPAVSRDGKILKKK